MNEDTPFLRAILANPRDETSRLIYADWLEERGDLRGDFLRLDSTLVKLRGNSKKYPRMRDRWLELRRGVDDRWARSLSFRPIADIEGLVHFLREFHRSWLEAPALDVGLITNDLPRGLALIYRELGKLTDLERNDRSPFAAQDALVPLNRLERVGLPPPSLRGGIGGELRQSCVFAWENQGNWSCQCDLYEDDPPVYSNAADVWQEPQRGFQVVCESLNRFLITLCLHEAVFSSPCLVAVQADSWQNLLTNSCTPLWSGPYVDSERSIDFFAVAESDAIIMNRSGWWIASHSDEAAKLVKKGLKPNRIF